MRLRWVFLFLAFCTGLFLTLTLWLVAAKTEQLPPLQVHPLPPSLRQWQDSSNSGDYFSEVKPVKVGSLVWSRFPIVVYVEMSDSSERRAVAWRKAVLQAVKEWHVYLPIELSEHPETADITIWRRNPPRQRLRDGKLARARSGETRYELYVSQTPEKPPLLLHRCTISISPNQTELYITASARHELGHALGIWGHSRLETDALYFSQVRNPPRISPRDVNTLKRVYQQPTRLGWPLGMGNKAKEY
ncbi:MAG: peptidase [Oscillatoriaceae bacterium SKW80]|nr:peptidase [Oscillatoriaceae bacterium SKYG93]MCX8122099.1 peptidase [Oscillatoriaceae bacterium SKW80]MDW8454386.1 peptidase [Oscillatoriaceae cyanobacterium SKYGB_i_bin93]HIK29250.1 peptidase [Oscillatoriaceae cyanobacterium M7585_C2015_266]